MTAAIITAVCEVKRHQLLPLELIQHLVYIKPPGRKRIPHKNILTLTLKRPHYFIFMIC